MDSNIIEFSTLPATCEYLKNETFTNHYKYIFDCSFELNSKLVKGGWRRFGKYFLRPNCKDCNQCKSLRIDVENFKFSKSARRVINKNKDTKTVICSPTCTFETLDLYAKYHKFMHTKRSWKYYDITVQAYNEFYVDGANSFGREALYFVDKKLAGVDLFDFADDGISSIYFFYDPEYSHLSLGKYSIYRQILLAKEKNLKYIYLGHYVENCQSLKYKAQYKPYELLVELPEFNEDIDWR